ncbi:IS5 family transposase [Pyxidicoccus sp. MSG2]|uniref:IS5 family transposase n=1 Tax=Pyxidicoccus sp. MSG2 TaxID=2996790 RepID=UPI002270BDE2|nr:IS5 family transposase [Pyxidicoccus sp. MSG2]MCY1018185.1 IS5 family transposase [Pyxidicoccus sp. MSG2]
MRGTPKQQTTMFSLRSPRERVAKDHPLRRVKDMADAALAALSPTFDRMYSRMGRPSIPPEQLLKASLLMAFYSVRGERLFCEQLDYNLLFRWFLDMGIEEVSFDHSTFSVNRTLLLEHDVARQFFAAVVGQAQRAGLTSSEHFSTVDFHGQKRSNATHESKTDPEAKLMRKGDGKEAKLSYCLNGLMENRHGLLIDLRLLEATGTAERDAAIGMLHEAVPGTRRVTVGADKGYDTKDFVADCRHLVVTPHVAQNASVRRRSAIDARTTTSAGSTAVPPRGGRAAATRGGRYFFLSAGMCTLL